MMIPDRRITSRSNPEIRAVLREVADGHRGARRVFFAEGPHLLESALAAAAVISRIFVTEAFAAKADGALLLERLRREISPRPDFIELSDPVLALLSDTKTPQGIIGLVTHDPPTLESLALPAHPLLVVSDAIRDPGNLGTIIRVADAAGVHCVILLPGTCDALSPKVVRSTAGSIFSLLVVESNADRLFAFLEEQGIALFLADGQGAVTLYDANLKGATALAIGNEGSGVGPDLRRFPHQTVRIPIAGKAESLNAAIAASICLYESVRQRLYR